MIAFRFLRPNLFNFSTDNSIIATFINVLWSANCFRPLRIRTENKRYEIEQELLKQLHH